MTKTYNIAAIPADGIGVEVIAAGIEVLDVLAEKAGSFTFKFDHFDWGSDYYKKHGVMMPADGRDQIRNHDAIFFGAVGAPGSMTSRSTMRSERFDAMSLMRRSAMSLPRPS